MKKINIVIPSRKRFQRLCLCIKSFTDKAKYLENIKFIVIFDYDDTDSINPEWIKFCAELPIVTIIQHRSAHKIRDYDNLGARMSNSDYIWAMNDDVICNTKNWDSKISYAIERFLEDKADRVCLALPRDGGPNFMFPIITKETTSIMNGLFPEEISGAYADTWLYRIFKNLSTNRIVELDLINIKPEILGDETARDMKNLSSGLTLTESEFNKYVDILNRKIAILDMIKNRYYDYTLSMLEHWVDNYGDSI